MKMPVAACIGRLWIFFAVASLCACGRGGNNKYITLEGAAWHTSYRIVYQGDEALADSVLAVFPMVENSLSPFIENSVISRINDNCDSVADALVVKILSESQRICRISGGAFDPTVSPLVDLWGFGTDSVPAQPPSAEVIDSVLRFVGICRVEIDSAGIVRKPDSRMQFNFSAITKGYGCDLVAEVLRRNGVKNFMVEIGGEVVASGVNRRGDTWHIQIDAPDDSDPGGHNRMKVIPLHNSAVATSGNYRNYRDIAGAGRVGHTISPGTGRPVATSTLSASVVAPHAFMADALATAAMVMPAGSALQMIEELDSVEGMLVVADTVSERWQVITTAGFPIR